MTDTNDILLKWNLSEDVIGMKYQLCRKSAIQVLLVPLTYAVLVMVILYALILVNTCIYIID